MMWRPRVLVGVFFFFLFGFGFGFSFRSFLCLSFIFLAFGLVCVIGFSRDINF